MAKHPHDMTNEELDVALAEERAAVASPQDTPKSPPAVPRIEQRHLNAIDLLVSDASDFWAEDGTLLPVIREVRAIISALASNEAVLADRKDLENEAEFVRHAAMTYCKPASAGRRELLGLRERLNALSGVPLNYGVRE